MAAMAKCVGLDLVECCHLHGASVLLFRWNCASPTQGRPARRMPARISHYVGADMPSGIADFEWTVVIGGRIGVSHAGEIQTILREAVAPFCDRDGRSSRACHPQRHTPSPWLLPVEALK
jgi:hypothetical protein